MDKLTLATGDLAYLDSFAGLVPVKVTAVAGPSGEPSTAQVIEYKVTAGRGAYRPGDVDLAPGTSVVPRKAVASRSGQLVIQSAWTVLGDA